MNIIDHIEKIIKIAGEDSLSDKLFENAKEHLEAVSSVLKITHAQAAIFSLILDRFGEDSVSADDLAKNFKCGKMQLIRYMDDFEALRQKRLIKASSGYHSNNNFPEYTIPLDVIKAVRNNTEYTCERFDNMNPEDLLDYLNSLLGSIKNSNFNIDGFNYETEYIFEHNKSNCFVKKIKEYDLNEGSIILMVIFCHDLVQNDSELIKADNLFEELREIAGFSETRRIQNRLKSGKHKVVEKGLIQFECQDGMADTEHFRLTEKAKEEFLADIDFTEKTKRNGKNIILAEKITEKKLYYSEKIKDRINELTELLGENNFSGIQKRLTEKGMRTGFACIFSGPPGTGKTETAYQIAKKTGRDIMLVNISETKSMWFGESEKRIKSLFDRYRGIVKSGGLAPILFFNEADAVLGKRRELSQSRSGPDQTENAIQNIILQEMENLNGILIATTNMTVNLDKAFERRFLYKIEFEKPNTDSKIQMWQNFIPELDENDAEKLAVKYDFSGGQIENIARKNTVSYILKGIGSNLSILENFCKEELLEKSAVRIGFCSE
jgi:SpoVK/Ycf46/Vps4 family AAA+-type ATPase